MKDYYDIQVYRRCPHDLKLQEYPKEIAQKEHPDRGGNEARF